MALFINQLPELVNDYIEAGRPVEIAGAPGIGKSEAIEQLVQANSERDGFQWGLAKVFGAAIAPVDAYGFLVPGVKEYEDWEGKKITTRISEFTMPPWMVSTEGLPMNKYRRGIVLFDEFDKSDPDVKKALAEPILNGSLGTHRLHKGIARVVLVNRSIDRSGTTKNFDFIINRRGELQVQASLEGWLTWAMRAKVDPMFTSFAERHPQIVFTNKVPDEQGPFCTPRSLVANHDVLTRRRDDDGQIKIDEFTNMISTGWIGQAATAQLLAWLRVKTETPDWADIVRDPEGVTVPDRADGCLMSCHECAHRVDLKTIRPVIRYARRMPKEFAVTFAQAAISRVPELIADRNMREWSKENRSLLNVLGGAS